MDGRNILLVDNDLDLLHSLEFILEAADFRVVAETDGRKALERIIRAAKNDGKSFDLLITDIQMPGLTGLQLIDELRRMKLSMPVLVITAYGDSKMKEALRNRGRITTLDKPFYEERLLEEVFRIVGEEAGSSDNVFPSEGRVEKPGGTICPREKEVVS